jgi:protein-tyrosine phosphatase
VTDVLIVCTANVARSPLLAARLQMVADGRLGAGAVAIASTGTHALVGAPAAAGSRRVAEGWGADLGSHRATHLMEHDIANIPLIVVMVRRHRRMLAELAPQTAGRSFTLRELRLALEQAAAVTSGLPPSRRDVSARLAEVARAADAHRPRRLGRRRGDTPDPIGRPQAVFDRLGREFDEAAVELGPVLFGC